MNVEFIHELHEEKFTCTCITCIYNSIGTYKCNVYVYTCVFKRAHF